MSDINFWIAQYPIYTTPPINPPTAPMIIQQMNIITNSIIFSMSEMILITIFVYLSFPLFASSFRSIQYEYDPFGDLIIFYRLLNFLML